MTTKLTALWALVAAIGLTFSSAGAAEEPSKLSTILIPGQDWTIVSEGHGFVDGPSCDAEGNFYFSDLKAKPPGIFKVAIDGTKTKVIEAARSGTKMGADGKLYACGGKQVVSYELPGGKETVLADGAAPNDLVITNAGQIYFTETGKKQVTLIDPATHQSSAADVGINKPNGIGLSPDHKTLYVSDYGGLNVWAFKIEPDGKLTDKKPLMTMKAPEKKPDNASGDGMTVDVDGRVYVTTALGIQIFAPGGELLGILPKPKQGPLTSTAFGGENRGYLYATCGDTVFRRKVATQGAAPAKAVSSPSK